MTMSYKPNGMFGALIEPNKELEVKSKYPIWIHRVSLDEKAKAGSRSFLKLQISTAADNDESKAMVVVASLSENEKLSQELFMHLSEDETYIFSNTGANTIHVFGEYHQPVKSLKPPDHSGNKVIMNNCPRSVIPKTVITADGVEIGSEYLSKSQRQRLSKRIKKQEMEALLKEGKKVGNDSKSGNK